MYESRIDVAALHWMLWDRANGRGQIQINEQALADELMVSRGRVSHVLIAMRTESRITRPKGSRGPYSVADPATWPAG